MAGQHPLLQALNSLKAVSEKATTSASIDSQPLLSAFEVCSTVSDDIHYAHALLRETAEIAIRHQQWSIAEEFAIRTLKKVPNYGAALKVLGKALRNQDRPADAAICHRYGLPSSIREKYFSQANPDMVSSKDSDSITLLTAYPEQFMPLTPPVSLQDKPIWELSQTQLNSAAAKTFQLSDARLWFDGFNIVVWDSQSKLIIDASRGFADVVQCAVSSYSANRLKGRTCVLGNRNSSNYYHWMNDILPRLHVLTKSGIDIASIDHFVINPLVHPFQYETLERFGIKESQLSIVDNINYVQCDELFVPTYGSNTLGKSQAPWSLSFIKSAFLDTRCAKPTDRLYISRRQANGRSIENEEELVTELVKRGFRRVELEGMSVAQQASTFNKASVILSPHGAGLSNIVYCEPETTIIELYDSHIAPCFWITSEMASLRHAVLRCGRNLHTADPPGGERYHESADSRRLSNFRVDLGSVRQILATLDID